MNKKMRELMAKIDEKTAQAKAFLADGENKDVEKATKLLDEADSLKAEYEAEKRLYEAEKAQNAPTSEQVEEKKKENVEKDSVKAFATAARRGFKAAAGTPMTEGVDADGGYTVPEDIQTRINQYRDAQFSLRSLVRVENVTTNSGARTFQVKTTQTGFSKVAEKGAIGSKASPTFERITYSIDKYAGWMPVTNELLADSDANITNTVVEWLGGEARATDNTQILTVLKTLTSKAVAKDTALDDIKKILNVDLGQAYKPTSVIVTNDSGLNFLDTLKDSDGRYLLTASPADPMRYQLAAGATVVPVRVVPNSILADTGTKIPFFIGDLYEAVELFDRQTITIKASDVAVAGELNAYEDDLTLFRGILRLDVVKRDAKAAFFAELDTASAGVGG